MPKTHSDKTAARLARRAQEAAAAVAKPKPLTPVDEEVLFKELAREAFATVSSSKSVSAVSTAVRSFSGAGSSAAAVAAAEVERYSARIPDNMAKVIVDICDGNIKLFDAAAAAQLFRDYMSSENVELLQRILRPLPMLAENIFYPSAALIHIECGARAQTYFFHSTLNASMPLKPQNESNKAIFDSLLKGQISDFLTSHASMPGVIVIREFASGTRELLGDAIYRFSPSPLTSLALPFRKDDSDSDDDIPEAPADFVTIFNSCDLGEPAQSEVQALLKQMASALLNLSIKFTFKINIASVPYSYSSGTNESPKTFLQTKRAVLCDASQVVEILNRCSKRPGTLSLTLPGLPELDLRFSAGAAALVDLPSSKLSNYLKSADAAMDMEQLFLQSFRQFSLEAGLFCVPGSIVLVRFDDTNYVGRLALKHELSEDELRVKQAEFSRKKFDPSDFNPRFEALLCIACTAFKPRGAIIISFPDGRTIAGAFDPIAMRVGIKYLEKGAAAELLSALPDVTDPSTSVTDIDLDRLPGEGAAVAAADSKEPTLLDDLSPYIVEPYRSQLAEAFHNLRDFIVKKAGVSCSIGIGDTVFKFGGKKSAGSMNSQQRMRLQLDLDAWLKPAVQYLQYSSEKSVISVRIDGAELVTPIKPIIKSTAVAGAGSTAAADAALTLGQERDGLQAQLDKLKMQVEADLLALRVLELPGPDSDFPVQAKARVLQTNQKASTLRVRIAEEKAKQLVLEAEIAAVDAKISARFSKARIAEQQLTRQRLGDDQASLVADIEASKGCLAARDQAYAQAFSELSEAKASLAKQQQASEAGAVVKRALDAECEPLRAEHAALTQACAQLEGEIAAISAQTETFRAVITQGTSEAQRLHLLAQQQQAEIAALEVALASAKCEEGSLTQSYGQVVTLVLTRSGASAPAYALAEGAEVLPGFTEVAKDPALGRLQCLRASYYDEDSYAPPSFVGPFSQGHGASVAGSALPQYGSTS